MSAGHTPGPWTIQDNAPYGIHIYSAGGAFGGGKHLARASTTAGVDVRANARLIAAAPDLLAALTEARQQIEYLHEKFTATGSGNAVLSRISAAIARAEGRS